MTALFRKIARDISSLVEMLQENTKQRNDRPVIFQLIQLQSNFRIDKASHCHSPLHSTDARGFLTKEINNKRFIYEFCQLDETRKEIATRRLRAITKRGVVGNLAIIKRIKGAMVQLINQYIQKHPHHSLDILRYFLIYRDGNAIAPTVRKVDHTLFNEKRYHAGRKFVNRWEWNINFRQSPSPYSIPDPFSERPLGLVHPKADFHNRIKGSFVIFNSHRDHGATFLPHYYKACSSLHKSIDELYFNIRHPAKDGAQKEGLPSGSYRPGGTS
jgi:hypothetical protein